MPPEGHDFSEAVVDTQLSLSIEEALIREQILRNLKDDDEVLTTSNLKLMTLSLFPRKLFEWLQKGVSTKDYFSVCWKDPFTVQCRDCGG